jgi:AraC-like DNA-binding protein
VQDGQGSCWLNHNEYAFAAHSLLCFAPFQPFQLRATAPLRGVAVAFSPEFFCIELHKREVACNGVLFNNVFDYPRVQLPPSAHDELHDLLGRITRELSQRQLAQEELLFSYVKILLITATRLKTEQLAAPLPRPDGLPLALRQFQELLEQHYRALHQVHAYAELLHLTPKALGKLSTRHFGRPLMAVIQDKLLIEAKRELYLTPKSVKEIAYGLGFEDAAYFSRFFKKGTGVTAEEYRRQVGNVSNTLPPLSLSRP